MNTSNFLIRQLGHSLSESSSFKEIVHLYTTTLIEMANEDPVPIKFFRFAYVRSFIS